MSARANARSVLVVEDDLDIRDAVVEILQDEGYDVSAAADGRQALDLLETLAPLPDIILLDLMMPVMNGFQFREEQLKKPALARVPVLIVTADAHAMAKAEALQAAGFIQKPLKIQPLLDTIERVLSQEKPI
jgi:CheY-like chemotaxis protein